MQLTDYVAETEGLAPDDRAEVCRQTILALGETVFQFETDIPWSDAAEWPATVRRAAEVLVAAAGKTHTAEGYQQTGMLRRDDEAVWEAFATFAGYAYDASAWSDTRALPIVSLEDAGGMVVRIDEDELLRLRALVHPVRVVPLEVVRSAPISWKDWVAAAGGVVVGLLLMAQLFVTIAWDAELDTSPGLFVLGVAVIVMSAAIIFDRARKRPYVSRLVRALFVAAFVLIVGGMLNVL